MDGDGMKLAKNMLLALGLVLFSQYFRYFLNINTGRIGVGPAVIEFVLYVMMFLLFSDRNED
jgi:hypothetical protein